MSLGRGWLSQGWDRKLSGRETHSLIRSLIGNLWQECHPQKIQAKQARLKQSTSTKQLERTQPQQSSSTIKVAAGRRCPIPLATCSFTEK